jgi:RecA-family ATPase
MTALANGFRSYEDMTARTIEFSKAGLRARPEGASNEPNASDARANGVPALKIVDAGSFAGKKVPERQWLVQDLIPMRQVTLFSGDGGTGKSLLALQLGVAVQTGSDWIGTLPAKGSVLYISAEDEIDEHHRRLADICAGRDFDMKRLSGLRFIDLTEGDAILAHASKRRDGLSFTSLYDEVEREAAAQRPKLVVIDTSADVFAGEESNRSHVRQFVSKLRRLALKYDVAIVLLSHPSLTGITSGSGLSGSTAWNGSVRSRLYLEHLRSKDEIADPNLRVLTTKKANYGPLGGEIRLRWEKGRFVAIRSSDRSAADKETDRLFLRCLADLERQERPVSDKKSSNYAPTVFSKHPDANGTSMKAFERAMERLLHAGTIKVELHGPPSKLRHKIGLVSQ